MNTQTLEIKAALQIARPVAEVFEAIVDPAKMSNYFISFGSGRMDEAEEITWGFPEMEMRFPIRVAKTEKDQLVSFYWDIENRRTLVEIQLATYKNEYTIVTVMEKSMPNDDTGINWLKGNTEGWANFLACLKAWLEYGVHLRKNAFDFRFETK